MAIDSKVSFINQTEKRLSTEITQSDMNKVLTIISDVMEGFDITERAEHTEQNEDLLNCYIDALKVMGRSELTIQRYQYILSRMIKDIGVPTRRITVYHLRNYLAEMQKDGKKDSTIEGIRQVLSAYFNWLQRESLIGKNPVANLGAIKVGKRKKKTLTEIDIKKLENACKTDRDKAILAFLYSTGCRISEMTSLDRESIRITGNGVTECVVHGKGNKERTVYLSPVAGMQLAKYLDERKDDHPALFINRLRNRLQPDNVRDMLNVIAKIAGVEHVHPHKFRRTRATELARKGMLIQEVAHILGHEKIDTTMQYVMQNEDDIRHDFLRYAV